MSTSHVDHDAATAERHPARNWVSAVLAVLGAVAVVAFAYVQVLGTAGCTAGNCGGTGPGESVFGLILYGTPIVAVVALALSFVTAKRTWGWIVPTVSWLVVLAALIVLLVTF